MLKLTSVDRSGDEITDNAAQIMADEGGNFLITPGDLVGTNYQFDSIEGSVLLIEVQDRERGIPT